MALCNTPQVFGARSIIRAHTAIRPSDRSRRTARGRPDLTGVRHAAQASHLRESRAQRTQWHCATPHKCWGRAQSFEHTPLSGPLARLAVRREGGRISPVCGMRRNASHLRESRALHTQWHCATPHKCWRRAQSFAPLSGPPTPLAVYGEREAGSRRRVPYGASTHIPPAGTSRSSLNDLSTSQASAATFHVVRLPPRRAWAAAVQEQDGGRISPVCRTWRKPAALLTHSTPWGGVEGGTETLSSVYCSLNRFNQVLNFLLQKISQGLARPWLILSRLAQYRS